MATKITREVLESYLNCKTKAHLKLVGQHGSPSEFERLLVANRQEVRQQAIGKILAKHPEAEIARDIPLTVAALRSGPSFVLDATLEDGLISLGFDGLKRVDGPLSVTPFEGTSIPVRRAPPVTLVCHHPCRPKRPLRKGEGRSWRQECSGGGWCPLVSQSGALSDCNRQGSKLGDFHYVPMLFHEGRKVAKEQKLLLELYGLILSRLQGQMP